MPSWTKSAYGLCFLQRTGKRPSSVEEGYSSELESNIPPNKPVMLVSLPALCNNVSTAAPANLSPPCLDKTDVITTELFVKDELIDPLHQVVSNDVCAVLTQSQKAALEEEGEAIVARPYTQQIMEMNSDEPLQSEDTPCLENISIVLPFKEMASYYPGVIDSLMQFVEASNNTSIHLVNKNSTYSDCTYCDILVNKVKVQAIIDSGTPVNIVSTTLVKQLKIVPNVDYCKQYGNAGPTPTFPKECTVCCPYNLDLLQSPLLLLCFHRDFDILIGTQFMQNFGAKIDFQENVLEILGQKLPIYYTLDGIIPDTKRCNYINIAYQKGIIPVQFY
ncbi:hypothetical protein DSO57_1004608 [Entomophthora muscae]|uniref:Uncharacterized protein n=1 Tax=Entomophthora muscae TaxID=34485 RepID=A0ACC2TVZ9_9FUNG|nr:hypothetical protein DSO57_1004608 [Entomophthora muscae]